MKIWKRNAIIAAAVMLVCGGVYLNWQYGESNKTPLVQTLDEEKILDDAVFVVAEQDDSLEALAAEGTGRPSYEDEFAQMRLSRRESRDSAVELLQETIAFAGDDEDMAPSAQQLSSIVRRALSEAQIESLVVSKGYADCVAYMTDDGISLAVAAPEAGLAEADVALLTDIVCAQTDYELPQIRIIEVG